MNGVWHIHDIPYNEQRDQNHKRKFDLFLPEHGPDRDSRCSSQLLPNDILKTKDNKGHNPAQHVVLFVHGGGWRRGDKQAWRYFCSYDINILAALYYRYFELYSNVGKAFARRGIPCAVMSYPLVPLKNSWIIVELLSSYICTFLVLAFVTTFMLGIFLAIYSIAGITFSTSINVFPEVFSFSVLNVAYLYGSLTNIVAWMLITINHKHDFLSKVTITVIWLSLLILIYQQGHPNIFLFLVTLVTSQGFLVRDVLLRDHVTIADQLTCVDQCLIAVERIGRNFNLYNPENVCLVGHSAGAHLCTMIALNNGSQGDYSFSKTSIKGVIPISGVLHVENLNTPELRNFYLHPTFGKELHRWREHCPVNTLKRRNSQASSLPRFLVVTADKDYHLIQDAKQFLAELNDIGAKVQSLCIANSGHLSIISHFDTFTGSKTLADHCFDFITLICK